MSNRRRTRPARNDRNDLVVSAEPEGQVDEDSDLCDCPVCMAERTAPVFFDMLIDDHEDPVGNSIEAERGMALLFTMGVAAGVDYKEWYAKILADLTEAGTTQATGMMAALASLTEGQARADALDAIAKGPSLPQWAKELLEPLTVLRCLRLEDEDGDVWALVAEFSRSDARHAFALIIEPDYGYVNEILACAPDELLDFLTWVKQTASDKGYPLKEIELDPAAFRAEAEAAIEERHALDAYDPLDDEDDDADLDEYADEVLDADDLGDADLFDDELQDELDLEFDGELDDMSDESIDAELDYYSVLPVLMARLRQLPETSKPETVIIT